MSLLENNLGLAKKIASKYSKNGQHEFDDLYQEACFALWNAEKDFDDSLNVPFGAFAGRRIQFHLLNYMRFNNVIKTPHDIVQLASNIKKYELENESFQFLAERFGFSKNKVEAALERIRTSILSIDAERKNSKDNSNETWADYIAEDDENRCDLEINLFLDKLKPKDRVIMKMLLDGYQQKEIADAIGTSAGNVWGFITRIRNRHYRLRDEYVGVSN